MATTIELKNSVTTGNSPSSLAQGETGWNITDKKVWIGNASSTPIQLIGAGASMTLNSLTASTLSSPAATALTIQSAGTTAITVDTSQNVGIGVTPQSWNTFAALEISRGNGGYVVNNASAGFVAIGQNLYANSGYKYANSAAASLYYQQGGVHVWQNASSGTAGNAISFTEAMRIDSSGQLIISSSTAWTNGRLQVNSATSNSFAAAFTRTATGDGYATLAVKSAADGANVFFYNPGSGSNVGSITTSSTLTSYNVTSDRRLKENIKRLSNGLSSILALNPSEYNYISDKENVIQGFIADELQQVIPHAVTGEKDAVDEEGKPIYQSVDASFLIPHLVSAIQEQQALITDLQARLTKAGL